MMVKRRSWTATVFALFTVLGSMGCATVFHGRHARVNIESLPNGATVWVDGQLRGETPLQVMMTRDELHSVRFALDGHEEVTIQTDTKINGTFFVLNIFFGSLIVDAITGAWYEPGPRPLRVLLSPKGQRCASGGCVYLQALKTGKNP